MEIVQNHVSDVSHYTQCQKKLHGKTKSYTKKFK